MLSGGCLDPIFVGNLEIGITRVGRIGGLLEPILVGNLEIGGHTLPELVGKICRVGRTGVSRAHSGRQP